MASLIEELIDTLDREEKIYANLIPVQEEKIRAIVANDLNSLNHLSTNEQKLIDEVGNLEKKRVRVTEDIATVLGKTPGTMNLEKIIGVLSKQPEEQKRLQILHDRLRDTMSRLKELNIQNKQLLTQALEMVEFNMNVIRSTRMSSGSSNYSSNASEVAGMAPQHGMFDAKQ